MKTVALALTARRNAPFPPDVMAFQVDGVPLDLTGRTFALDVRLRPGAPGAALISLNTSANDTVNGIWPVNAVIGEVRIQISQNVIQAAYDAAGVRPPETAVLAYDLLVTDGDGFTEALIEGAFNIEAGVTQWT